MQRSRATLGEVCAAHAGSAKRLACLLTGDRELAEDTTQDAFVKLAGRLGASAIPMRSAAMYGRRS